MAERHGLRMDPASASSVAARARTENFPVASLLFPRALRPHLRAVYGFARLVDVLGDEFSADWLAGNARASSATTSTSDVVADRLAALDELEIQLEACYEGEPTWEVMRALQPTIRARELPRDPFLRLIEANRIDQRVAEYDTWDELKGYCVHSADPVGRLVLGVVGRTEPELV
ncbi:MAG: squalene/phytoene synthase family protein, partial [Actinomycetota bacterium]|nr:squalene/phytoene synthase family protein [Actinomycetota bacterium]